jgi:hypothetical protein
MTNRERDIALVQKMPSRSSYREIIRRIEFVAGLEEAIKQSNREQGVPIEEVRKMVKGWVKKASARKAKTQSVG